MTRRAVLVSLAGGLLAITGCGNDDLPPTTGVLTMTNPPPPIPPSGAPAITSITVTPQNAFVPQGGQLPFHADCVDENGMHVPQPPTLVWSVDSAALGSVGPQGLFGDNQPHTVTVRATVGAVSGTALVTVS